jgi:hypothetical protein
LQAAEKGLKRLMEAYEWLQESKFDGSNESENNGIPPDSDANETLDEKVKRLLGRDG